tara:strand:- start:120 stop:848 length:729 start_codon:yes stop_codon:yes gene_type:complete
MRINFFLNYFRASKTFIYSVIITFPLIVTYELLHINSLYTSNTTIINSFDFLSLISDYLNFKNPEFYKSMFIFIIYFLIIYIYRTEFKKDKVKIKYALVMVVEGFIYSILLYLLIMNLSRLPLLINSETSNYIKMSIGAGIWEEFIFRVILINLILHLSKIMFNYNVAIVVFSVILSSLLFAYSHFIGPLAEQFIFISFLYRFVAGLYLGFLYLARGYGIAVYSHMFYDLFLFVYPTYNLGV